MGKNNQARQAGNPANQQPPQTPWGNAAMAVCLTGVQSFVLGLILDENSEIISMFSLEEGEIEIMGALQIPLDRQKEISKENFERTISNAMASGQYAGMNSPAKSQMDVTNFFLADQPQLGLMVWNQEENSQHLRLPNQHVPAGMVMPDRGIEAGICQGDLAFLQAVDRLLTTNSPEGLAAFMQQKF